uniref:Putative salivary kunitz domain protein n=1 Tax=Ixodes ricinus TaxID=34613 RepID=A0A0K8RCZ1_IXORI
MKSTMQFIFAVTFVILACGVVDAKPKIRPPKNCTIEPQDGPCRALHSRYFFNMTSRQCEHFYYGGCLGNRNRFMKKERCEKECKVSMVKRMQPVGTKRQPT